MTRRRAASIALGILLILLLVLAGLWLARARLAAEFARAYFRNHGVAASVEIGSLGLSGVSGRFALGPAAAPDVAADSIELFFDPLRWRPYLVEVRLKNPVVRAKVGEDGKITLPSLQAWLDSLSQSKEKSPYVSDDLAVSFTGLRALLATPAGAVEIDGDARLVKMRPVSAALTVKPGALRYRDMTARIARGALTLTAAADAYHLVAHAVADVARGDMRADGAALDLDATDLRLHAGGKLAATALHLTASAKALQGGGVALKEIHATADARDAAYADGTATLGSATLQAAVASMQDMASGLTAAAQAKNVAASVRGVAGDGTLALSGTAMLPDALRRMVRALPLLAMDAPLKAAVTNNLGPFSVNARVLVSRHDSVTNLRLAAPLTVRTAKGGLLRVTSLAASRQDDTVSGSLQAALSGGGLPPLTLKAGSFTWNAQGLRAAIGLRSKLDFATFKGIDTALDGTLTVRNGAVSFTLARCGKLALAALGSLATKVSGQVCPATAPFFALDESGWRLAAEAKEAAAFLPLANAQLRDAAARLAFDGKAGPRGTITVTAAAVRDVAAPLRFKPLAASGSLDLTDGVWRGRFDITDGKKRSLGTVTLTHAMASGDGSAHVEAPLVFAQNGLQPEDLSPLLAPLKKADGRAGFQGDFAWDARGLAANTGTLTTKGFDFLTPMGRAHALDTTMALTSLLPPATADGQALKIARIDWTLPFSAVDLRFGFNTQTVKIDRLESDFAEGHVALAPFAVTLAAPQAASRATITGLSLAPLIAASNLSGKAALVGKVSGVIPFTAGPEGFRIKDGHLTADGPGRLSLSRSLWGESAVVTNAVQDFAYQALENLAFESLSADINSVDKGRLQIVFHIKGRSDPPQKQVAEVAVLDIIQGNALTKPIPLPSGTPIDLTLDTSLNFDELLQSYAQAWSKALNSGGADN
jgi:hypothetical protein